MTDLIQQLRGYGEQLEAALGVLEVDEVRVRRVGDGPVRPLQERAPTARRSAWRVAVAAAVAAILIGVGTAWLTRAWRGGSVPVTEEPPAVTSVPATSTPATTRPTPDRVTAPLVDGGGLASGLAPIEIGPGVGFARTRDTLWAWDGLGRVAGYRDGAWRLLPPLRATVLSVTGAPDGGVWAVTTSVRPLWVFEDGEWREVELASSRPPGFRGIEQIVVDPATGILWAADSERVYRLDDEGVAVVGSLPEGFVVDTIAVTADGSVWASRFNPLFPDGPAGLVRFDPDAGTWEWVRPLAGDEDVPAVLLATPGGDLWALLSDYEDWPQVEAFSLVHFDAATGDWTVLDLPPVDAWRGDVLDLLAADDGGVWIGYGRRPYFFDGETWTLFRCAHSVDDLGVGADGSLWADDATPYSAALDRMYRLVGGPSEQTTTGR